VDTGKASRLTTASGGFEGVPSFSPDGKWIAYSYVSAGQHSRVIVANSDGSGGHPLATPEVDDFRPLFATNNAIVFARSGRYGNYSPIAQPKLHEWTFYVCDLAGENARQITDESFYMVSRASVSPDGRILLFAVTETPNDYLAIYSLDGSARSKRMLTPKIKGFHGVLGDPNVLSDGKTIVFLGAAGADDKYDYDIYRMDLDTEVVEALTSSNGYAYNLRVSPDGRKAVFSRDVSRLLGKETENVLFDSATRSAKPLTVSGLK
jgi:Tol biopolymer transport system component